MSRFIVLLLIIAAIVSCRSKVNTKVDSEKKDSTVSAPQKNFAEVVDSLVYVYNGVFVNPIQADEFSKSVRRIVAQPNKDLTFLRGTGFSVKSIERAGSDSVEVTLRLFDTFDLPDDPRRLHPEKDDHMRALDEGYTIEATATGRVANIYARYLSDDSSVYIEGKMIQWDQPKQIVIKEDGYFRNPCISLGTFRLKIEKLYQGISEDDIDKIYNDTEYLKAINLTQKELDEIKKEFRERKDK